MKLARNQRRALAFLAGQPGEMAGIDIADGIDELGRSSVYAALAALQRDALVDARWDHSQSHPRRLLKINGAGRRLLADEHLRLSPASQPATAGTAAYAPAASGPAALEATS